MLGGFLIDSFLLDHLFSLFLVLVKVSGDFAVVLVACLLLFIVGSRSLLWFDIEDSLVEVFFQVVAWLSIVNFVEFARFRNCIFLETLGGTLR